MTVGFEVGLMDIAVIDAAQFLEIERSVAFGQTFQEARVIETARRVADVALDILIIRRHEGEFFSDDDILALVVLGKCHTRH